VLASLTLPAWFHARWREARDGGSGATQTAVT
jgi:hypothetical protein